MADQFHVSFIKEGIIRISKHQCMPESYLERYGIVKIPEPIANGNIKVNGNDIILPDGKTVSFDIRPDQDDDFWKAEEDYLLNKFAEKIPKKIYIEGRPNIESIDIKEIADGKGSDKKFGISFKIGKDEKFYGLGEAGRDRVQLRGTSHQNWTIYQFNEIPIPFVMSNHNVGVLILAEDRHFVDIDDNIKDRLTILGNHDELDLLLFYGDSMKELISLYTEISGRSMLFPKWAYGLTYIAQIHQNQFEILNDMLKFREKHIPCDNVSLEPGWMTKFYDYSFEKQWDLKKFHMDRWMRKRDYQGNFPSTLRRFGFHMALWMCMNYDLCDREEGLAGGESKLVPWYEHVKQFVNDGADGFKIDPADMVMRIDPEKVYTNGKSELQMHNVSQVLVMKQMFQGFTEQMNKRPFIHYSGGYIGQQHWGGATTGDNGGLEGSMIWLQNLAMSGFMNTTVDMNIYDPAAIHFAMLAPWAHHNAWSGCQMPWFAGPDNERIYTFYARLRYSLLPYIYSTAIECNETGVPMIRPMPLEYQNDPECADLKNQYMIGESLLLSAFTNTVYLPEGKWIDYWTGEEYEGKQTLDYVIPKDRGGALFVKNGAIIPMWCDRDHTSQYTDEVIQLHFYPLGESRYVFREDDGESLDYTVKESCKTVIECKENNGKVLVNISERSGEYEGKVQSRTWEIFVHGKYDNVEVKCASDADKVIIK
jgi:alpha-glucosidase (family GH31 glycosyl hydrolase)